MAGIPRKGATPLVIFKGNLDNKGLKCIAKKALFPFIRKKFPVNHILYMDNAPAHSAYVTSAFFTLNINNFVNFHLCREPLFLYQLPWPDRLR